MKIGKNSIRRIALMLSLLMLLAMLPSGLYSALAESIPTISYMAHVQSIGDQKLVRNGKTAGTTGQKLRMEALTINLKYKGKSMIQYTAHIPGIGWKQGWKKSGQMAGTTGQSKAIEAVKIKLTGSYARKYDVYYRVHVAHGGWLGWAKNGGIAGSTGMSLRVEAIQIKLTKKGSSFDRGSKPKSLKVPTLSCKAYCQGDKKWRKAVGWDKVAGTTGQGKRLEALSITLKDYYGNSGVTYRAHVSKVGWQGWKQSGQMAGTKGQSLAIEAVEIKLNSVLAKYFDIYYRAHVAKLGWLGWAKNGETAGTTGGGVRMEAIQICLQAKDKAFNVGGPAYLDATKTMEIKLPHYRTGSLKQNVDGPCMAFAYAAGLSIITHQDTDPMAYYGSDGLCYPKGHINGYTESFNGAEIYRRLKLGLPTLVHYDWSTPKKTSQHWVLIAGIRAGADPNNLQYGDFLVIDSDGGNHNPQYSPMTAGPVFKYATMVEMRLMY